MYFWSKQGEFLSSELDLTNQSHESIYQYMDFIDQWKLINHPLLFDVNNIDINIKKLGHKDVLSCRINVKKIGFFSQSEKSIKELSSFDKLALIRNLMVINDLAIKNNVDIFWHLSMLRVSKVGNLTFWLPQPVNLWWKYKNSNKKEYSRNSIIQLLFNLFDFQFVSEISVLKIVENLEKKKEIPWGWSIFIEYYLNNKNYNDDLFLAVFYKIWLYRTANQLGMSNKVLSIVEYNQLHQFGKQLGLSNQQMNLLDIVSQKAEHQKIKKSWVDDFLKP
jgi:hypothetical protein